MLSLSLVVSTQVHQIVLNGNKNQTVLWCQQHHEVNLLAIGNIGMMEGLSEAFAVQIL